MKTISFSNYNISFLPTSELFFKANSIREIEKEVSQGIHRDFLMWTQNISFDDGINDEFETRKTWNVIIISNSPPIILTASTGIIRFVFPTAMKLFRRLIRTARF